jgi:hypothetical protein
MSVASVQHHLGQPNLAMRMHNVVLMQKLAALLSAALDSVLHLQDWLERVYTTSWSSPTSQRRHQSFQEDPHQAPVHSKYKVS